MPCVRQNVSHHSALFCAATRISDRSDTPCILPRRISSRSVSASARGLTGSLPAAVPASPELPDHPIDGQPQPGGESNRSRVDLGLSSSKVETCALSEEPPR